MLLERRVARKRGEPERLTMAVAMGAMEAMGGGRGERDWRVEKRHKGTYAMYSSHHSATALNLSEELRGRRRGRNTTADYGKIRAASGRGQDRGRTRIFRQSASEPTCPKWRTS